MSNILTNVLSYSTPQLIAILVAVFVFMIVLFIAIIYDEIQAKHSAKERPNNEWLFTRWDEKLYDAYIKSSPEETLKKMGVKTQQYLKNCEILHIYNPNLKKLAARKISGLIIGGIFVFIGLLGGTSGLIITMIGLLVGLVLYDAGVSKINKDAQRVKKEIMNDLPRFMDLLQTALFINTPVDEAITLTARNLRGTVIAEELLSSMAETQVGALNWQEALQGIAMKFEINQFSDFVMYLITGYEKGLSIFDLVSREAKDIRAYAMTAAEENANKVNTSILLPLTIFKLLPMILLLLIPVLMQMGGGII